MAGKKNRKSRSTKKKAPSPKTRRKPTKTSAFGVSKREGHDSSAFYASKLYRNLDGHTEKPAADYIENLVPPKLQDHIVCASSEHMDGLPDCSVHLMVTSPPYNVGKEYDKDLSLEEYLGFMERVCREVYRVLVPGGRACINVANVGRKPYIPLHLFFTEVMLKIGFSMRGEVIWDKSASAGTSTAWGSWKSPSNPTLRDVHEYILIFSRDALGRKCREGRDATISKDDFLELTKSVWTFPTVSARKVGHPAPFPVELPRRLIELYTFSGEVVLDPFMGSGQTAIAAIQARRSFVGYEKASEYARMARRRAEEAMNQLTG